MPEEIFQRVQLLKEKFFVPDNINGDYSEIAAQFWIARDLKVKRKPDNPLEQYFQISKKALLQLVNEAAIQGNASVFFEIGKAFEWIETQEGVRFNAIKVLTAYELCWKSPECPPTIKAIVEEASTFDHWDFPAFKPTRQNVQYILTDLNLPFTKARQGRKKKVKS